MRYLIWHSLESIVFMTVALVIYLVRVIRKKPLARSLDRKEDIICKLIIGCILAYTFYFGVFPQTRDIPNIINKNIYTVEGVAQGYNEPTRSKKISVYILDDETQEDVYVTFYYEKAHLLPKRELLFMRGYADTVFTDIVDSPFLMVSELIKKVICIYQPETIFKEIILLDAVYEKSRRYFLPVFRKQHCLSEKSILNLDRSVIKQGILSRSKLNDQAVFRIGDVKNNYTVGRLDFVESILKRGAVGVGLTELGMED